MDDPNITMEEYIRLEEERAQRHGQTFNWQTTTFRKVKYYEDEDDYFADFEAKFLAIVLGNINAVTSPSPEIPYYKSAQGTTMREYEAGKEDSEIEFPAIVLDNTSTSDTTVSYEPTLLLVVHDLCWLFKQFLSVVLTIPTGPVFLLVERNCIKISDSFATTQQQSVTALVTDLRQKYGH
ncbi:hypothetical protein Tco_1057820 [Tanacetum coccineum]|uniref:Uncharacterized protein n=1 Tax=Tanacetum coccineum TaxID=301880 RepID=A0ABQ5H6G2_9ASTR